MAFQSNQGRLLGIFAPVLLLPLVVAACTSVSVWKLNPDDPQGIPFYLSKPMKKIITTSYKFYSASTISTTTPTLLTEMKMQDVQIINVIDTKKSYAVNKFKASWGESKFKVERATNSTGVDLAKVEVEDKEGLTDFLKGIFEGAKSLAEAGQPAPGAAGAALGLETSEIQYFSQLFTGGIFVVKTVSVDLQDL